MKRRKFIRNVGCGAMGSATLINSLVQLGAINGATGSNSDLESADDYKALVCILLSGGIDSYNVLMPYDNSPGGDGGYGEYVDLRTDLSLAHSDILPLTAANITGHGSFASPYGSFAVHPGMSEVKQLFETNKLAFISNIGTLVEPLANKADYQNDMKKKPLGIYSHNDQRMQWMTSVPQSRDALGVGGRMADLLHAQNDFQAVSMNISLDGKNRFQTGQNVVEYAISNNLSADNVGFDPIRSYGNAGVLSEIRNTAISDMVTHTYQNLLQQTIGGLTTDAIQSFELFKEALAKAPSLSSSFSDTNISQDLAAIAKVMSIRNELGAKRQIFFLDMGGWDMHDNLLSEQAERLPQVSRAMKEFYDATFDLGIADQVTTFTISDFARTTTSNGQGSDHAWGGNHMVMGGAVKGRSIYGSYARLNLDENPLNVSNRGNFIPAVSTDEFYAELALWYGISPSDLCYVLPNLGNFYSYSAGNYPIGFMDFAGTQICPQKNYHTCHS
ncbi:MAG: DUF1501 domain-containing protein, partial [Bacteroidota bacterium]